MCEVRAARIVYRKHQRQGGLHAATINPLPCIHSKSRHMTTSRVNRQKSMALCSWETNGNQVLDSMR